MKTIEMQTPSALRALEDRELDAVSGGNPVLIALGGALVSTLAGKVLEGVLEETGVTKQVLTVKNGKVSFLGRNVN